MKRSHGAPEPTGAFAEKGSERQTDPNAEALALTLRATGATCLESIQAIRGAGFDPGATRSLVDWVAGDLRLRAERRNQNIPWLSDLAGPLEELMESDPVLANAAFLACEGLRIERGLILKNFSRLKALPTGLQVKGDLDLRRCAALECLPEGLVVGDNLDLQGCALIKRLPDNLFVGGWLYLSDCPGLEQLPKGLRVGRHLDLRRCRSWDGVIPADTRCQLVCTDAHPNGISLAGWRKQEQG